MRTVDEFTQKIWDKIELSESCKEVCIKVNLSELAREADAQTHIFSDFTDEELEYLMKEEFGEISLNYEDYRTYYEQRFSLADLILNLDFKRAVRYADDTVTQEINQICEILTEKLEQRIQFERLKPFIVARMQETKKKEVKELVRGWLQRAVEHIESQRSGYEAERKKTEEKAEADYQKRLAGWKQDKADYLAQYNAAVEKRAELMRKIDRLEQEIAQLKGLFTGKKRKELEKNLISLKMNFAKIDIPRDPGESPNRGDVLDQERFHGKVSQSKSRRNDWIAAEVFPALYGVRWMYEKPIKVSVGQSISFGTYPYDKDGNKEKIQWLILDKKENSLLLLTEKGIDVKEYHKTSVGITWETCSIRTWLNDQFLNDAFSKAEKDLIQVTNVNNRQALCYDDWNIDGGNNTQDKVFLLSYKEAFENYFSSDTSRKCFPTEYAQTRGVSIDNKGYCSWWLRSPGLSLYSAAVVGASGSLSGKSVCCDSYCIRPALWINLDSVII